jgi:phosphoribosyl-ATP pyrophosphohydrolase/phosphoribosyl-AMP cyclohydrolase
MPLEISEEVLHRFLFELESIIVSRKKDDPEKSYTAKLLQGNINRLLQKVGEESIEYIIEAKSHDKEKTISEAADLLFHFLVSLHGIDLNLNDILSELYKRHYKKA